MIIAYLIISTCCTCLVDMLDDIARCWRKFDFHQMPSSTTFNISFVLRCEQECCIRLVTVINNVERAHAH